MRSLPQLILLLPVIGLYFGAIRPRKKQMRAQQEENKSIAVGDEVMLTSGIYGTIRSIETDEASVEIAPGTTIRIDRRAIARKLPRVAELAAPEASA